ncbi:CaiB/BaiF CoA transferase family protein [Paraburkholderia lycopersici]|uniref:Crotonobetainyl-CoA:carnitine CoA-transferase CaiB n=1 Tax=Paraburkholderia lycopersici TaxID=416944 RepID=A0A1G6X9J9_9BURK|nr:CoA transferase [Paraburkholderia lycopersici]SDD74513.1 Crotonobetainyl-CoA:carnitine CoA-transferase CaiB [Paraburkholderia lycopersici]
MKLAGIRVLDLSSFLPGPYLTLALADHGAEVIKVEQPGGGDPGRQIGPMDGETTVFFRNLNRGKKSVTLDLKAEEGREALLSLCETADVFVESFRPGVVKRLGVDYEHVRARNPRIVYCSISAFGQSGPYAARPAHDLAVEALSGVLSMTLGAQDEPAMPGVPLADLLAGLQGVAGVLMALLARERTGEGDYIDIGMHDAMLAGCLNILGPAMAHGEQPVAKHQRTTGGAAFYRTYRTADGRYVSLAGQEPKFVESLLGFLGRLDLQALCARGPGPHQQPVIDFLAQAFLTRTAAEWDASLSTLDLCYAVVKTLPEALEDDNAVDREMVLTDEAGRRHIAPPVRFARQPAAPNLRAPALGEHNGALLGSDETARVSK